MNPCLKVQWQDFLYVHHPTVHEAKLGPPRPGSGPSLAPLQSVHGRAQERTEAREDSEKGATTAKLTEAARIPGVEENTRPPGQRAGWRRKAFHRAAQDAWGGGSGVGSPKSCHEQGRGAQGGRLKPMTTSHPALGGRPRWPMINHEATYGRLGEAGARVYLQGHLRGKVGPE